MKTLTIWQCEWELLKDKNPQLKQFEIDHIRPMRRLSIREAYTSAPCETFCTYFDCTVEKDYEIMAADVISLYPFAMLNGYYPTDKPEYLVGKSFFPEKLSFENGRMKYYKDDIEGVCLVTVFPPSNLIYPFLIMNINNKKIGALCKKCAEEQSLNLCSHTQGLSLELQNFYSKIFQFSLLFRQISVLAFFHELCFKNLKLKFLMINILDEKSYTTSLCIPDIIYMKELGYTFEFHEIFIYRKREKLYEKHIKSLARSKIKYSCLPNSVTLAQKQEICDKVNEKMNFNNPLAPNDLTPNPLKRQLYKNLINHLYGIPAISTQKYLTTKFVSSNEELQKVLRTLNRRGPNGEILELRKIHPIGNMIRIVHDNRSKGFKSQRTCVILSAYTSSYARIFIHKMMMKLHQRNCRLLYMDCDSFYYAKKLDSESPLDFGSAFGDFRNLFEEYKIVSLASLGPKSLSLQIIREKDGEEFSKHKMSGFQYTQCLPNGCLLQHCDYLESLRAAMDNEIKPIQVFQRQKTVGKDLRIKVKSVKKSFGTSLRLKRVLLKNTHETVPFGFLSFYTVFCLTYMHFNSMAHENRAHNHYYTFTSSDVT